MSNRPLLKHICDLNENDLSTWPVWAAVMSFDYDEPWYDDATEETFRPWNGPLPVSSRGGMYVVQTVLTLADMSVFKGFATPQDDSEQLHLGFVQPQIFLPSGGTCGFWSGMLKKPESETQALYRALSKEPSSIFPIRFAMTRGLSRGHTTGVIPGFCWEPRDTIEIYY